MEVQIRFHRRKTRFSLIEPADGLRSRDAQVLEVRGVRVKLFERLFVQLTQRARFALDGLLEGLDSTFDVGIREGRVFLRLTPLMQCQRQAIHDRIKSSQSLFEVSVLVAH